MIQSIRHKGLRAFFVNDAHRGVPPALAQRISRPLDRLDGCSKAEDMDLPGYKFHPLKGARKGTYVVTVSGNLRMSFHFDNGNAVDVNLGLSLMKSLRNPKRRPTHPGAILREDVLPALKMTQTELALLIGVSRLSVSELLHEKRALSPDMAVRIATLLRTTPESWLRMREAVNLWDVRQDAGKFAAVKPLSKARLDPAV